MGLWFNLICKITARGEVGSRPVKPIAVTYPDARRSFAASRCADTLIPSFWNVESLSRDGTLSAVAEVIGQGRIRVSVRAFAPELQNSSVSIVLRSKSNPSDVWLSKKITLDLNHGLIGLWTGPIGIADSNIRGTDAAIVVKPVERAYPRNPPHTWPPTPKPNPHARMSPRKGG